ncbi:MAG: hypothetical protein CEE43_12450 [Promethearchaeota archaeon Loki_b32]|nr:MAG: hypothetical protein CEE43_12450 [Candidatus Lokiarchaeota archaeon Loki_b32]
MDYLERNYQLIKERMIQQMENSIVLGRKLIDTVLDTGFLNFIINPIVKSFYDHWAKNDAKYGTLKQIQITLDSGKHLVLNGKTEQSFEKIIEENFPRYFKNDQTFRMGNNRHKNFDRFKQNAKETFTSYLEEVVKLLEVEEDVGDYGDLCRVAFNSKEVAEENLMRQLEFTEKGIKIVEEDPYIIKVPVGRKIIVKALRRGYELTKKEFIEGLNDTYNQK